MIESDTFVIVGAGLAGAKAAEHLRKEGFGGRIVLTGAEPHRPYERPPLSKDYLMGKAERESVFVHAESWYTEHEVELLTRTTATAIDATAHQVEFASGDRLAYRALLLATGSSPRRLSSPGSDVAGIHYLRTIEDSDAIRTALAAAGDGARVVVVGGGWIGLETAAAARQAGADVTVLESGKLPLLRACGPEIADVFTGLHRKHGVDVRTEVAVTGFEAGPGGQSIGAVLLDGGERLPADVVIVGIGIVPNTELAASAGLDIDNGVLVDQHLRTSVPGVFAAGDVANAFHPFLKRHVRVEHWANALHQPEVAARSMLGQDAAYDRLPYFYSDQYELGMECTGYFEVGGYDRVVIRGSTDDLEFIAFWLNGDRVLAGMNVNVWDVSDPIAALVLSGRAVDAERLADPQVPLAELAGDGPPPG